MDEEEKLDKSGFIRLPEILKLLPVSRSTWWEGVKIGRFPKAYKLSNKITAWKVSDIETLITKIKSGRNL